MSLLNLERTVAPSAAPVALSAVKLHLGLTTSAQDPMLEALVASAVGSLDGYSGTLGRALVTQTWVLRRARFPMFWGVIDLPLPPLQEVAEIAYIDPDGVRQVVDPSTYVVYPALGQVEPVAGKSWPSTACRRDAVEITFVAGYGEPEAVPDPIKSALKIMIADLYANREGGSVNPVVKSLLGPFRVLRT